ncbi:hypothetical protein A2U01_0067191 [Trifolium medium]|uniref:Uncharacterized protein n=1 Tax=Trifolium medium TaxID=97028 RepID=A0A392SAM7_9FABA|nr:hypothetical protein [Trifolium medium]
MIGTDFPQLIAQNLHKFPCWCAAPSVLRDARVSVMPVHFEFFTGASRQLILRDAQLPEDLLQLPISTARRAIQGCAAHNLQKISLLLLQ